MVGRPFLGENGLFLVRMENLCDGEIAILLSLKRTCVVGWLDFGDDVMSLGMKSFIILMTVITCEKRGPLNAWLAGLTPNLLSYVQEFTYPTTLLGCPEPWRKYCLPCTLLLCRRRRFLQISDLISRTVSAKVRVTETHTSFSHPVQLLLLPSYLSRWRVIAPETAAGRVMWRKRMEDAYCRLTGGWVR